MKILIVGAGINGLRAAYTLVARGMHAFVIEEPPGMRRLVAVSACSGRAFKLTPLTGERVAEWVGLPAGCAP